MRRPGINPALGQPHRRARVRYAVAGVVGEKITSSIRLQKGIGKVEMPRGVDKNLLHIAISQVRIHAEN